MIKKIVSVLIAICSVFCFCACSTDKSQTTETSFDFVGDFSNQQGYKNWYYMYGDVEENPKYMVYDVDRNLWLGRDYYSRIQIDEQHPGGNTGTIIAFEVPRNGKIKVEGSITRCPVEWNGDGVYFYVAYYYDNKFSDEYLFSDVVEDKTPTEYSFELDVKEGAFLYFTIDANGNNTNDSVTNKISINYI